MSNCPIIHKVVLFKTTFIMLTYQKKQTNSDPCGISLYYICNSNKRAKQFITMKKSILLLLMLLFILPMLAQDDLDSLRIQAEAGDATSQFELALEYLLGDEPDEKLAFEWMQKAVDQNEPNALFYLGYMYSAGIYVEEDSIKAHEYVKAAADQGNDDARNWMAIDIIDNDTTQEHWPEAVAYFLTSAANDNADAHFYLGKLYENGMAVERDLPTAYKYYRKAVQLGKREAADAIGNLYAIRIWSLKDYLNKDEEDTLDDEAEEQEEQ